MFYIQTELKEIRQMSTDAKNMHTIRVLLSKQIALTVTAGNWDHHQWINNFEIPSLESLQVSSIKTALIDVQIEQESLSELW